MRDKTDKNSVCPGLRRSFSCTSSVIPVSLSTIQEKLRRLSFFAPSPFSSHPSPSWPTAVSRPFPSSIDGSIFGDAENEGAGVCRQQIAGEREQIEVREKRDATSWPEWCFPRVSMSIYLPEAYSDKSVIVAEANEKVARSRRCCRSHYHHTITIILTNTTITSAVTFTISTLLRAANTLHFLSVQR